MVNISITKGLLISTLIALPTQFLFKMLLIFLLAIFLIVYGIHNNKNIIYNNGLISLCFKD